MDDQKDYANQERQLLPDNDFTHKILKQERHLLEDLHDAQEAEARALERFRRVQSKLQRRKARVLRLENRLALIRKEITALQVNLNTPEQQNGHVSTAPDAPASDLAPTHDEGEVVLPAPTETSLDPADAAPAMSVDRPDTFEPEPYVTPVFILPSEPAALDVPQPTHTVETQPAQEQPSSQEGIVANSENGDTRTDEPPIFDETNRSLLELLAHDASTIAVELSPAPEDITSSEEANKPIQSVEAEPLMEATAAPMLEEPMELQNTTQTEVQPTQHMIGDAAASASPADSIPSQQTAPPAKTPAQILTETREAWQAAEAGVQQARNRAHDLAASISILAQTGLSGSLMEELLRKQSEANKALSEAQRSARGAYDQLVQAEEADHLAQQEQQSHNNGLTSTTDEGIEATVQMHAIHLYKEW